MAILRRLDKKAEAASVTLDTVRRRALDVTLDAPDWDLMLTALRTGDEEMIAQALAEAGKLGEPASNLPKGDKVSEVSDPPIHTLQGDDSEPDDRDPRCWWDEEEECWMTDFPPPPGFDGYQQRRWGDEDYRRECTAGESAVLAAALDAETAEERAEDEALRDQWFAALKPGAPDGHPVSGTG